MRQRRGSLYLLTGLILGFCLGLMYVWLVHPINPSNTTPRSLQSSDKDKTRALIAMAFLSNGDLVRARARLALLGDQDPYQSVLDQAERLSVFGETGDVTALHLLATALQRDQVVSPVSPKNATP